jgi:serine/threonine protein kinase
MERSIVKRSSYAIGDLVENMTQSSRFLLDKEAAPPNHKPAVLQLNRTDVKTGELLGQGTFSYVYEVTDLVVADRDQDVVTISPDENDQPDQEDSMVLSLQDRQRLQTLFSQMNSSGLCIKHLKADLLKKPEDFEDAAADLILEGKFLAALDHPNIMKVRAVADESAFETTGSVDGYFLVMDRLDCTLRDRIVEWQFMEQERYYGGGGTLDTSTAEQEDPAVTIQAANPQELLVEKLRLALELAQALAYLHDRRLVYRDLKPHNVGLSRDNHVQLFDFGFCRELPQSNAGDDDANQVYFMSGKGSLMYLAPEVLKNGRYNCGCDCYSWATVVYELLTLYKPYPSMASPAAHRQLVCERQARPPLDGATNIPLAVQNILRHAWDGNVRQRWNMHQICRALEQVLKELQTPPPPTTVVVEAAAVPMSTVNTTKTDAFSPVDLIFCGAGGSLLDLLFGFASDVESGYQILTKGADGGGAASVPKVEHFQPEQDPGVVVEDDDQKKKENKKIQQVIDSLHFDILGNPTDRTYDSSSFSSGSLHLNAIDDHDLSDDTAANDPLWPLPCNEKQEQQDQQDLTSTTESVSSLGDDREENTEDDRHEAESGGDMELRCPASPLARCTSAPMIAQQQELPSLVDFDLPFARQQQYHDKRPSRRQSLDLGVPIVRHHQRMPRRQSYAGHVPVAATGDHREPWHNATGMSVEIQA